MTLLRNTKLSILQAINVMRAAGMAGDLPAFSEAFRAAADLVSKTRNDDAQFSRAWKQVLRFEIETSDVSMAVNTVERARSLGVSSEEDELFLAPMLTFLGEHGLTLKETFRLIEVAAAGHVPQVKTGLQINCWFRLLIVPRDSLDARDTWMSVTSQAIREAKKRNIHSVMIPDYLVSVIRNSSHYTLSFHTEGERQGSTHFKPADLPGYAVIDCGGYSGWSSLARSSIADLELPPLVEAAEFYDRHVEDIIVRNVSKYPQATTCPTVSLPEKFVFVPLQVKSDRTQELARISMMDMLDMVVERFHGTDTRVVVKRHPKCRDDEVAGKIAELSSAGAIVVSEDSIHTLVSKSQAVFTVNSGVGSEAIVHLKPIYLFGDADYNCAVHQVIDRDHFWRITETISPALSDGEMKQFLCYYRTRYLVKVSDRRLLSAAIAERVFGEMAARSRRCIFSSIASWWRNKAMSPA